MQNYSQISTQLRKELEELPRDYTRLMATRNWDVITDLMLNFNIGRLLIFMDNYYNGIPDKIYITEFGVDGPASTSILYYDGKIVTHIIDGTRYQTSQFYYYYGYHIVVDRRNFYSENYSSIDYKLINLDGTEHNILSIWAGYQNPNKINLSMLT